MRRAPLLLIVCTWLSACSATPAVEEAPPRATATARVEVTATAEAEAPPELVPPGPAQPHYEKPFRLAVKFPRAEMLSIVDDSVWLVDSREIRRGEAISREYIVYELSGGSFQRVGARELNGFLENVTGVHKVGTTVYLVGNRAYGRGSTTFYEPVRGPGRAHDTGDDTGRMHSLIFSDPRKCDEKEEPGRAPMKDVGQSDEIGKYRFYLGTKCESGTKAVQIVGDKNGPRWLDVGEKAYLVSSSAGLMVADEELKLWDGKEFMPTAVPAPPKSDYLTKAPDGVWFATSEQGVYMLKNKQWSQVALPDGRTTMVLVSGKKTLFAFSASGAKRPEDVRWGADEVYQYVAEGTEPPAVVNVTEGTFSEEPAKPPVVFEAKAPGPKCKSNIVVLYGFTKVTPLDYDFPLTRKAVKGHNELKDVRFVVTEDRGAKYFVAKTPSFESAKQVAKIIESGVQGSKPQVLCAEPKELREVKIDLATGDVKK